MASSRAPSTRARRAPSRPASHAARVDRDFTRDAPHQTGESHREPEPEPEPRRRFSGTTTLFTHPLVDKTRTTRVDDNDEGPHLAVGPFDIVPGEALAEERRFELVRA